MNESQKDKKLAKLVKKMRQKVEQDKARKARFVDPTLEATAPEEQTEDQRQNFAEMKRREF